MKASRLVVCDSSERVARRAAASLVAVLQQALLWVDSPQIVFSAGATPVRLYEILRTRFRCALPWQRLHLVQMDEYAGLHRDDPRRFSMFLHRALVNPLGMRATYLTGDEDDAAMARYEAGVQERGGIACVLHGLGTNGHLGFNEPGSAFAAPARKVRLAPSTSARVPGDTTPVEGVTLGLGVLNAARFVRLVALGTAKARAVHAGFFEPVDDRWPVSSLQGHQRVRAFVDAEAYSLALKARRADKAS